MNDEGRLSDAREVGRQVGHALLAMEAFGADISEARSGIERMGQTLGLLAIQYGAGDRPDVWTRPEAKVV